jgi:adenylate cyclase
VGVCLVIILLQSLSIFADVQNLIYDKFFIKRPPGNQVLIAAIDDKSLNAIGAWPWSRDVFAKVLDNLSNAGARVVGFDVVFGEGRSGDDKLVKAINDSKAKIVLAGKLLEDNTYFSPLPKLLVKDHSDTAFVNFESDRDGKIRHAVLFSEADGACRPSLALEASRLYVNSKGEPDCSSSEVNVGFSKFNVENKGIRINFVGSAGSYPHISLNDIYSNNFDKSAVKDKIVLIGSTIQDFKSDLQDNLLNPFDGQVVPGVEMHANTINTILSSGFIYEINPVVQLLFFILGALIAYALSRKLPLLLSGVLILSLSVAFVLLCSFLFGLGWIMNVTALPLLMVGVWILENLWQYYLKRKENLEIKKAFGQYVNNHLLGQILKDPDKLKLGGINKVMTVIFSDIRGFTSISEQVEVEQLVHFLNIYLTKVTQVIMSANGTVDKYIGDAVMALWGAPLDDKENSANACKAALDMQDAVDEFNEAHHAEFPKIKIGVGINSGNMIAGNMGSEQRFDYTVLGDNVNLGSRLEGLTKQYGVGILMGENVVKHLKSINRESDFDIREVDTVQVKGKAEPVIIYELMRKGKYNTEIKKMFGKALNLYYKSHFKEAKKLFEECFTKYQDNCSDNMSSRCAEFMATPDPAFKGVYSWLVK